MGDRAPRSRVRETVSPTSSDGVKQTPYIAGRPVPLGTWAKRYVCPRSSSRSSFTLSKVSFPPFKTFTATVSWGSGPSIGLTRKTEDVPPVPRSFSTRAVILISFQPCARAIFFHKRVEGLLNMEGSSSCLLESKSYSFFGRINFRGVRSKPLASPDNRK